MAALHAARAGRAPYRNGRDARYPSATDKMSVVPVRCVRRPRPTTADARERVPPAAKMAALNAVATSCAPPAVVVAQERDPPCGYSRSRDKCSVIYFPHMCGNYAIICGMTTTAILSSKADYTSFSFGGTTIRFLAPRSLVRYTSVKKWHEGYLEVGADYGHGEEEEYIDIRPILRNLLIDPKQFLAPIKKVELQYV